MNYEFLYRAWEDLQDIRYGLPKLQLQRFHHREERKNGSTTGQYRFRLPHGRVQVVSYRQMNDEYLAKVAYLSEEDDNECLGIEEGCVLGYGDIDVGSFEGDVVALADEKSTNEKHSEYTTANIPRTQQYSPKFTSPTTFQTTTSYLQTEPPIISTSKQNNPKYFHPKSSVPLFIQPTDIKKSPGLYNNIKKNSGIMYGINNQVVVAYNYGSGIPRFNFSFDDENNRPDVMKSSYKIINPKNRSQSSKNIRNFMNERMNAFFDPIVTDVPLKYFPPGVSAQGHAEYYIPSNKIITTFNSQDVKTRPLLNLNKAQLPADAEQGRPKAQPKLPNLPFRYTRPPRILSDKFRNPNSSNNKQTGSPHTKSVNHNVSGKVSQSIIGSTKSITRPSNSQLQNIHNSESFTRFPPRRPYEVTTVRPTTEVSPQVTNLHITPPQQFFQSPEYGSNEEVNFEDIFTNYYVTDHVEPTTYKPPYVPIFIKRPNEPIDPTFLYLPSLSKNALSQNEKSNLPYHSSYQISEGENFERPLTPQFHTNREMDPKTFQHFIFPDLEATFNSGNTRPNNYFAPPLTPFSSQDISSKLITSDTPSYIYPTVVSEHILATETPQIYKLKPVNELYPITTFKPIKYQSNGVKFNKNNYGNISHVPKSIFLTTSAHETSNNPSPSEKNINQFVSSERLITPDKFKVTSTNLNIHESFQPSPKYLTNLTPIPRDHRNFLSFTPIQRTPGEATRFTTQVIDRELDHLSKDSLNDETDIQKLSFPQSPPTILSRFKEKTTLSDRFFSKPIIPDTKFVPASSFQLLSSNTPNPTESTPKFTFKEHIPNHDISNHGSTQLSTVFRAEFIKKRTPTLAFNPHVTRAPPLYPPLGNSDYKTSLIRFPSTKHAIEHFPIARQGKLHGADESSPTEPDSRSKSVSPAFASLDKFHIDSKLLLEPKLMSNIRYGNSLGPLNTRTREVNTHEYKFSSSIRSPFASNSKILNGYANIPRINRLPKVSTNHHLYYPSMSRFAKRENYLKYPRYSYPPYRIPRFVPVLSPMYGRVMLPVHPLSRTISRSIGRQRYFLDS